MNLKVISEVQNGSKSFEKIGQRNRQCNNNTYPDFMIEIATRQKSARNWRVENTKSLQDLTDNCKYSIPKKQNIHSSPTHTEYSTGVPYKMSL